MLKSWLLALLLLTAHLAIVQCDDDDVEVEEDDEVDALLDDEEQDDSDDVDMFGDDFSPAVTELTWKIWVKTVVEEEDVPWLVMFYASWCKHCKDLKMPWVGLGNGMGSLVKLGAVNCAHESNRNLKTIYADAGFPTIFYFPAGARRKPTMYPYSRDVDQIVDFTLGNLPDYTPRLDPSTIDHFFSVEPSVPRLLLFTTGELPPNVFNALAFKFRLRVLLGQVKSSHTALVEKYGIKKFPQLIQVTDKGETAIPYDGSMNLEPLIQFVDSIALDEPIEVEDEAEFYEQFPTFRDFAEVPGVDITEFDDVITKGPKPTVIFFYHYWSYPCRMWIEAIERIYGDYKDVVPIMTINGDVRGASDLFDKLKIKTVPSLLYFPGKGKKHTFYPSEENNEQKIRDWIDEQVAKSAKKAKKSKKTDL